MKQIYKVVLDAQLAAIKFLRPGVTTMQADRVARDVIEKAGFGRNSAMASATASAGRFTSCRRCAKPAAKKSFARA